MANKFQCSSCKKCFQQKKPLRNGSLNFFGPAGSFVGAVEAKTFAYGKKVRRRSIVAIPVKRSSRYEPETLLHSSKLPLRKWVWAIYLMCRPKGIASTATGPGPRHHTKNRVVSWTPDQKGV